MLEDVCRRITRHLSRRGLFAEDGEDDSGALAAPEGDEARALAELAAATASGVTPPAGPAFKRGALPPLGHARDFDGHLSVGRGRFTLHAATRAGAMDERGREALLKYVLRPPIAQERIAQGTDGLVRIALKKPFSDATFVVLVTLDPARRCVIVRVSADFDSKSHASRTIDDVAFELALSVVAMKRRFAPTISGYKEAWKRACARLAKAGTPWRYRNKSHSLRSVLRSPARTRPLRDERQNCQGSSGSLSKSSRKPQWHGFCERADDDRPSRS